MAVKVRVSVNGHDKHATGDGLAVEDGHLLVRKRTGGPGWMTIAIYAPGAWYDAEVLED